ncbi:hypothetical protein W97_07961 [Coniosporium apollinis CBS 100218]|uniref:Dyp-type peroxidase n=1 Tax=Coniosporium apollinis (strain CBS 100218) TaxID=1168221 RepID=R7Z3N2_CONA1|nr:uncharacterized protein W97_07961 [Coniosporium apollinis CBS 100218]EON68703.1 hypothetical protein W97_07961 [Coniosporium apollinis CBS 100218]
MPEAVLLAASGQPSAGNALLDSIVQNAANKVLFTDVQGDILAGGLPKKHEIFWFFTIHPNKAKSFCQNIGNATGDGMLTFSSVQNILDERQKFRQTFPGVSDNVVTGANPSGSRHWVPSVGANISFSFRGLKKMSAALSTDLKLDHLPVPDDPFVSGMKRDSMSADGLGDPPSAFAAGTPFGDDQIDGVLIVAGSNDLIVNAALSGVMGILGFTKDANSTIAEVSRETGNVRLQANDGKEHFGFEDGISQPAVKDIDDNGADPEVPDNVIDRHVILVGYDTRNIHAQQPWMKNGSFLCFRKLEQHVDKWNQAVVSIAEKANESPERVGAKLMGRWPSGCPIMLSPRENDNSLARLPKSNRFPNFVKSDAGSNQDNSMCPLGAHIRKTNPRDRRFDPNGIHRILRRGIPYGPDFDPENSANNAQKRGLLFACYQSDLTQGFKFIQTRWANAPKFPEPGAGLDLTIGQTGDEQDAFQMDIVFNPGQSPLPSNTFSGINQFVELKGGEYFFTPSFTAMRGALSKV